MFWMQMFSNWGFIVVSITAFLILVKTVQPEHTECLDRLVDIHVLGSTHKILLYFNTS